MSEKLLTLIVLLAALALHTWGQVNRGTIRGTVSDPSGAVVAGAKVTAIHVASGVSASTVSTGAGNYSVQALPAGVYQVEAEAPGFKKLARENVRVEIGVIVGLDLPLEVGGTSETVTVTAEAPQLRKETSDLSTSVKTEIFMNMPLAMGTGRNPTSFAGTDRQGEGGRVC